METTGNEAAATALKLTERFRAAYNGLGRPRETVAKILQLRRVRIDEYQRGTTIPSEREVAELERRVTEKASEIAQLTPRSAFLSSPSPQLAEESMFYSYLEQWCVTWNEWRTQYPSSVNRSDLFFFSPERLSISDLVFGNCASANLGRSVNHHFFWILNGYTREELREVLMTLMRIEAMVSKEPESPGKIYFRPIVAGGADVELVEFYDTLRNSQANRRCLVLDPVVDATVQVDWWRAMTFSTQSPLVIARVDVDFRILLGPVDVIPLGNFVARRHEDVSLRPFGPRISGWVYLDHRTMLKLVTYLNGLLPVELAT